MNTLETNLNLDMKIFHLFLLLASFFINTFFLHVDWTFVSMAVTGSISGSLVLIYFRRGTSKIEIAFRSLGSSVAGLICGAVMIEYFQVEKTAYILGSFFISAFLSLIFLGALLSLSESNASEIIRTIFQRVFNLQSRRTRKNR